MSLSVRKFNSKQNVFERTSSLHRTELEVADNKRTLKQLRYKRDDYVSKNDKAKALTGAAVGALIPLLAASKLQKRSPWKLKYRLGEVISMSVGANVGSIAVSSINKPKNEKRKKLNEGVFQVLNSVLPMSFVDAGLKLCGKFKNTNNPATKIMASVLGVGIGTQLGIRLANKITDPKDLVPDRKYTAKDAIANLDDAVGILVLGKIPFADKIHIEKVLPAIYTYSGYRAGTSN